MQTKTQAKKRNLFQPGIFLFAAVSIGIIFFNTTQLPKVISAYSIASIFPKYGGALQQFYETEKYKSAGSARNWYAYYLVEKYFRGWTLIAPDKKSSYFSPMYAFNFGGIKATKIRNYDHNITADEVTTLKSHRNWQVEVERYGVLNIILPGPTITPGNLMIVRNKKNVFVVPVVYLPKRFSFIK